MRNIIVTGGSKGIGRAIVYQLARAGYKVILNYHQSKQKAIEIQEGLQKEGIIIEIFQADVSKRNEAKSLVNFAIEKLGRIDVLINNAGIAQEKLFTKITDEDWNKMIQVNLNSVFYMTQETVPYMLQNKSGKIINISSIWAMVGAACEVHYSVSKAAIDGMTKALAKELGPSHIQVNSIAPGVIETDMNCELSQEDIELVKRETPLGKIGKPEDIAKCTQWLVEDEFTTGQIISPNGGWVIV